MSRLESRYCTEKKKKVLVNKIIAILGKHASYPDGLNFEASSLFPFHNKLHGGGYAIFSAAQGSKE